MKVLKTFPTGVSGHVIEVVENKWGIAVRCRYENSIGGYNSSSPVVLRPDVVLVTNAAAASGLFTIREILRLLFALTLALVRKLLGRRAIGQEPQVIAAR